MKYEYIPHVDPYLKKNIHFITWHVFYEQSEQTHFVNPLTEYTIKEIYIVFHSCLRDERFNSWAPGQFKWNNKHMIFKQILVIDRWGISCEIALIYMSPDFTDDQSTLVQVMAWCRQATSHYLNQCWPRSPTTYGVTRPQLVKLSIQWTH